MRGISWLSEGLLASQEGLCSMELVKTILYDIPTEEVVIIIRIRDVTFLVVTPYETNA